MAGKTHIAGVGYVGVSALIVIILGIYVGFQQGLWWPLLFGIIPMGWVIYATKKNNSQGS